MNDKPWSNEDMREIELWGNNMKHDTLTCVLRRNDHKRLVPSWQIFNCLQSTATNGVVWSKSSKTTGNLLKLSNTWCTRRVTQSLSSKNLVVQDLWLVGKMRGKKSHQLYLWNACRNPIFRPLSKRQTRHYKKKLFSSLVTKFTRQRYALIDETTTFLFTQRTG